MKARRTWVAVKTRGKTGRAKQERNKGRTERSEEGVKEKIKGNNYGDEEGGKEKGNQ